MIGKTLGHYDVLEIIGTGGMGEVYRARDRQLDRDVALKILPPSLRGDDKALARFRREARALAALNHPNIVTIYSIERVDDAVFLTMELVDGKPLEELTRGDGVAVQQFREIALQLTGAVAAAHDAGVVHRDLKPANIIVSGDGRVKVLDFGVALVPRASALTEDNVSVGTVAYMSPEQISGRKVDTRSDIFSLGIVFHELLSGSRPFRGEYAPAIMYSIVNEDPPALTGVPRGLSNAVARCLAKNPDERFAGARELGEALREATGEGGEPSTDGSAPELPAGIQEALDREDWKEAYQQLRSLAEKRDLTAGELELLAECAVWNLEIEEATEVLEKAFAAYSKNGEKAAAARIALSLVYRYLDKLAPAVAGGWLKRAERLLENEPERLEHGLLLRRKMLIALAESDLDLALDLNARCAAIAERYGNVDLQTEALHDRGQILIARGDVEEGMSLIDEAMTSAVSGEVTPMTLGNLYCRTLAMCRSVADFNRARQWSEAAWRWTQSHTATPYAGICRVHSAETMRHHGLWVEAEQSVRKACDDFSRLSHGIPAGEAFNELGELELRKGNFDEAETAFRRALEFGVDPVPGLPLLRLAQGKKDAALKSIRRALDEIPGDRLRRARLLAAGIHILLANDFLTDSESAVEELSGIAGDFGCPCFEAHALMGRGAVQLERGDAEAATATLRDAWSVFKKYNFPYDAARAQTLMARAYHTAGNAEDAGLHLEAAGNTFRRLGARPDLMIVTDFMKKL